MYKAEASTKEKKILSLYNVYKEVESDSSYKRFYIENPKRSPLQYYYYLRDYRFQKIQIINQFDSGAIEKKEIPVISRWGEIYRKSVLKKMYQLEDWFNDNPIGLTFVTLTGKHVDIDIAFNKMVHQKSLLLNLMRKKLGKFDYVWMIEPHMGMKLGKKGKNYGYPHFHMIVFGEILEGLQRSMRDEWERSGVGDYEHGLDFLKSEELDSLKNYIIKDMAKSYIRTDGKFSKEFRWDKELFIFNYIIWREGYRMWGASRNLSKVMKFGEPKSVRKDCVTTTFCFSEDERHGLYEVEDYERRKRDFDEYIKDLPVSVV